MTIPHYMEIMGVDRPDRICHINWCNFQGDAIRINIYLQVPIPNKTRGLEASKIIGNLNSFNKKHIFSSAPNTLLEGV